MSDINISGPEGKFSAYIASPKKSNGAGLLIIQEIFGVNKVMRNLCDQYAEQGFLAVCPDLFWRIERNVQLTDKTEKDWTRALELMEIFIPDFDKGVADLLATIDYIRKIQEYSSKVGCIGYCLGGSLSYSIACQSDIDASVGYYPVQIESSLKYAKQINKPAMFHIAELDSFCPPKSQKLIFDTFATNKQITHHLYTGVDHAFARKGGENYNESAAERADERTANFLHRHLLKQI